MGLHRIKLCAAVVTCGLWACASRQEAQRPAEIDRSRIEQAFEELESGREAAAAVPRVHPQTHEVSKPVAATGPRPDWASNARRPAAEDYYHGIGTSRTSLNEARARALGDLASEIEVQVTSQVESIIEEQGYSGRGANSQIQSRDTWAVKLLAEQTFRDPDWVGHWSGQGEMWSYARLSKARFKADLERQLEESQQLAVDHLRSALEAERHGDVIGAAREFVRGLSAVRKFLGRPMAVDFEGRRGIDLGNELRRGADRTVSSIELVRQGKASLLATAGKGVADDLEVSVRSDGQPLAGAPVRFEFARGKGDLLRHVQSDSRGRARSRVSRIDGAGTYVIEARVDLAALAFGDTEIDPGLHELLRHVGGQMVDFHIGGVSRRFYVDITEQNLGSPEPDSYLARIVRSRLAEEGAVQFVSGANDADLLLIGTASTRFSSRMGAVVFCYADVSVRLVDRVTRSELYVTRQTGVKGADKSEHDAAQRAMENAADEIIVELLWFIRSEVQP